MSDQTTQRQIDLALEVLREKTRPPQWLSAPTKKGVYWVQGVGVCYIVEHRDGWDMRCVITECGRICTSTWTQWDGEMVAPVTGRPSE